MIRSLPFPALCLLVGCESTVTVETASPGLGRHTWPGPALDVGFGSRLATDGTRVFAGSPFGARVDELTADGLVKPAGSGAAASFYGAGLAVIDGQLWIGAPGVGELWGNGALVASEAGLGGVVTQGPGGWVASTPTGWLAADGTRGSLGRRPDALITDGDVVVAGAALGTVATWRGDVPTPRRSEADGTGFALARCDADADGVAEVVVGAPGRGEIALENWRSVWVGDGRFGAAIACGTEPGVLWVGAPAAEAHAGAVYRVDALGAATIVLTGAPLDELGNALVVAGGRLFVGAPGPASGAGYVLAVPEADLSP